MGDDRAAAKGPGRSAWGSRPTWGAVVQEALADELLDDDELEELLLEDELSLEVDDELLLDALSFDDELSFDEDSELDEESDPESLLPTVDPERLSVR